MNLDGTWVWQSARATWRNLFASRKLDLFAPSHSPHYGNIAILDGAGKVKWRDTGYDASMAMAPNGKFVVFASKTERADQAAQPPFPVVPELHETPEISVRDGNGKVLAHGPFTARLVDVSADSTCILARHAELGLAGFSSGLSEVWRLGNLDRDPVVASDLLFDVRGDTIHAYRLPACD